MPGIRLGSDSVKDIVTALLARAKRRFPKLVITGTLASQDNMLVYRITHEMAIDEKEPWLAIVKLTRLWKSDDHRVVMAVEDMKYAVEEYDDVVDQATSMGLVKPSDFAVAE